MIKIAKNEFENLIIPFQNDFSNNLKKQNNFILKKEFQNDLNDINNQLNSINNYNKELKNSIDNIYRLNELFVTKKEHDESIKNLLLKISELEKNINENKSCLEKKCEENIYNHEQSIEKKFNDKIDKKIKENNTNVINKKTFNERIEDIEKKIKEDEDNMIYKEDFNLKCKEIENEINDLSKNSIKKSDYE